MAANVVLRPASLGEVEVAVEVRTTAVTDTIVTAEGMRTWLESQPEEAQLFLVAAEEAETHRVVGWCTAARNVQAASGTTGSLDVAVRPEAAGRGVGGLLVAAGLGHLDGLGLETVRSSSPDGPAQRALANRFGYVQVSEAQRWAVDPRTVRPIGLPAGVTLRPFGDFDDPTPLFELDLETSKDVPGVEDFDGMTLDQWKAQYWHTVLIDEQASLAAYVDGELAGLTMLRVDRPSARAQNNLTATRRAYRGRGLARLMKSHSLATAAAEGATIAFTFNDSTNAPMLAVNQSLGYRPHSRWLDWERRRPG